MPARPASAKTMERRYKTTGRDLARQAAEARFAPALRLCLEEIRQLHAHHYPTCPGGCPAEEAMKAAESLL